MPVRKCDRCGKSFECDFLVGNTIDLFRNSELEQYLFCELCREDFYKWLKEGKESEK